jgi:hypothetical protein
MNNFQFTDGWSRHENEAPSCGATLRVAESDGKFLLVRADAWTGDFNDVLGSFETQEQAVTAMHDEARSES